jgi:hypothetical protein
MSKSKTSVYTMSRDGWTDYFELHVSPNARAMRRHIEAIATREGWEVPTEGWRETRGLVHPIQTFPDSGLFACLFLAEDGLGAGIVAHECLHVAMAHERIILHFAMGYGQEITKDEERLAYFLTDTIRGVYNVLYENGHIATRPGGTCGRGKGVV